MKSDKSLNIIFAGTPEFAAQTLRALLQSGHNIKAVYTQPDRPAGRGRKLTPSPVKQLALEHHLPVHQPLTLRDANEQKILADLSADLMVVVAYGLILPLPVLQAPRFGCLNVHASLLPRWRGAAPIQRAILAGDEITGVTIMQMDEGLDTGDMLFKSECPILSTDTSAILHDRLAEIGAEALIKTLENISELKPEKQNSALATYAHKISKEESIIDWTLTADEIERKIRAFNPWPVTTLRCQDEVVRVWQARVIQSNHHKKPGTILAISAQGIDVAAGTDVLQLQKIQFSGGRVLSVSDVLNAKHHFVVGQVLT